MADSAEKSASKDAKKMNMNPMMMAMVAVVVVALGVAAFFWNEAREANSQSDEAVAARNAEESAEVVGNLDKILLTESESEPTVARVEDPELLQNANPDFYKNVAEGDYLILYPQRAIIYRNSEDRIINIAPIIDTSQLNTDGASDTTDDESN